MTNSLSPSIITNKPNANNLYFPGSTQGPLGTIKTGKYTITIPPTWRMDTFRKVNQKLAKAINIITKIQSYGFVPYNPLPPTRRSSNLELVNASGTTGTPVQNTRITTSLAWLPIPQQIQASYPKSWQDHSTWLTGEGHIESFSDGWDIFKSGFADMWEKKNAEDLGKFGAAFVGEKFNTRSAATARYLSRTAINQKLKPLFDGIPLRNFTWTWLLEPRSQDDARMIQDWIYNLKWLSAPSLKGSFNNFFEYPNVFTMQFFNEPSIDPRDKAAGRARLGENEILFKTADLVCTDVSVEYTPNGIWSQHADGFPTAIKVSASFREVELATREKIEEGF